jgi:hypothetical protein
MRSPIIPAVLAAALAAAVVVGVPATRTAAQIPMGDANALMSMLIQPRHAKLGLAGKAENWPLAGYMFKELRQGFLVTARAVPRWKGLPVPDLFDAAMTGPLIALDFAIKASEPRLFNESYEKLTAGCNACHATTDHPFVVITAPSSGAAFPNQDFQPKR